MRTLALDYGSARCGCAVSDPSGTLATPLPVIERPTPEAIVRLVAETGAERVIVGLPVGMSGVEGPQADETRAFCERLRERLEVPVVTWDERLTSAQARRTAREAGARAAEDSLAAAHLLDSWLAAGSPA